MTSNEEQLELLPQEKTLYSSMDFETLIKAIENFDLSVLDRTRTFQPRKSRSSRTEPVSEEHRKMERNEYSRAYTKRNRDEISDCSALFGKLYEVRGRLEELLTEYKVENVGMIVPELVAGFESILNNYLTVKLHETNPFVSVYHDKAVQVMQYEMPTSDNAYATKLVELKGQLVTLYSKKDTFSSGTFSKSKSRLNQKIDREQWKSECWECWNDIQTLVLRGQELKKLLDQLKKQVWDNILAAHYHMFGLFNQQYKSQSDVQRIEEIVEYFAPFSRSPGTFLIKWTPLEEPKLTTLPPTAEAERSRGPRLDRPPIFGPPAFPSPSFALPVAPASYVPFQKSPCLPTQDSSIPSSSNALDMTVQVERSETRIQEEIEKEMNRKRTAPSSFIGESEIKKKYIKSSQKNLLETLLASAPSLKVQQSNSDQKDSETLVNWERAALASFGVKRKPIEGLQKSLVENTLPAPARPIVVQQIPLNPAALGKIPYNPRPEKMLPLQVSTPNFLMAMEQQRMMMAAFLQKASQRK